MRKVRWNDPELKVIIRLKCLFEKGIGLMDVDECTGALTTGEVVTVELPFTQLPRANYLGILLDYARRDGVFLKGLGVLDGSTIVLLQKEHSHGHR